MSSATPSPQDRASHDRVIAQQRAHEPSMEEILASIRRIIADDQRPPAPVAALSPDWPANLDDAPPRAAASAPPAAPRLDIVVEPPGPAHDPVREAPPAQAAAVAVAPVIEAEIVDDGAAATASLDPAEAEDEIVELTTPAAPPAASVEPLRLVSPATDAAVGAQFQHLHETLMADNARRVDELTRELLRPMLKSWLDDNLPVLVEKLVRAEIERVARGGR